MPQRYKLRLGDGTVMAVDSDGLRTWAEDHRAMAQAVGTPHWRPLRDVIAEEDAAARLARALVPPKAKQEAVTPPPPEPAPGRSAEEFDLGASVPSFEPARPQLQSLADDPTPVGSAYGSEPSPQPTADEDMPIIPMKRLDDEPQRRASVYQEPEFRSAWDEAADEQYDEHEEKPRDRLDGPLLTLLEKVGGFLSRCMSWLSPFADQLTERSRQLRGRDRAEDDDEPRRAPSAPARTAPVLTPLAEDPDRSTPYERLTGWLGGLRARTRRAEPDEPAPVAPVPQPRPAPPLFPERPERAPTPLNELPALKLKESREPRERHEVYGGKEPWLTIDLEPIWLWTQRLVVWGVVLGAVAYAVLERDTWFPRAARLGQTTFNELDRLVLSRERAAERQQALDAAAQRLPGLQPETIALVFAKSPTGTLEAAEVFERARAAAERGAASLPPADAAELRALQRQVLDALGPSERRMVQDYDRIRSRRDVFPFENPHVMELVARGVLALPPERLARLRALNHAAVAAGLEQPPADPPPAGAR